MDRYGGKDKRCWGLRRLTVPLNQRTRFSKGGPMEQERREGKAAAGRRGSERHVEKGTFSFTISVGRELKRLTKTKRKWER